ncbi:ATP synthase subunit C lysine N-methyltransferase isoform X3 [Sardina pilchardus]|uniref:ATP synthase subunit C lysine N-methyltransferase isoform X3 n=1 Tax=Sardina pilchardus TaxID=27697 RepID=UPI002E1163F6
MHSSPVNRFLFVTCWKVCRRFLSRKYPAWKECYSDALIWVEVGLSNMDDHIDVILQDRRIRNQQQLDNPVFTACTGALLLGAYRLWTLFALPGFRKVPRSLKVFAASSAGLRCTGYEINSILTTSARVRAWLRGVPPGSATFVSDDFWKTNLSDYNNVTVFLAPGVMDVLGEKLLKELPDEARVVACRFPFPLWPCSASEGQGLDQAWAYDMGAVRDHLLQTPCTPAKAIGTA